MVLTLIDAPESIAKSTSTLPLFNGGSPFSVENNNNKKKHIKELEYTCHVLVMLPDMYLKNFCHFFRCMDASTYFFSHFCH